jgi:DNA-binding NarL/FixJ family response regulator
MEKTTILIADDHLLVREAWSFIFNTHAQYQVIAECASGEEAITNAKNFKPDVVIMDINLPGMNGIEATQQILKSSPGSKVLGVSLHSQPAYARSMMQKGAMGYVTKNSPREEMFEALNELKKGNKFICKEIKDILSEQMINNNDPEKALNSLSKREIEIIGWLKKGQSSKEIANTLFISVKTVEVHRYNILKKLGLKNIASLVNYIHNSQIDFAA